jgi:DNA repair exonuclease SbcCD ATPase subunit
VTDRLDRIEADLETVKEILLTTASRTESTDKRIDNLALSLQEQNRLADERGRRIDERIDNLALSLQEQNRLADERGRRIDERLDRLGENLAQREDVDIAFQTISLLSENTDHSIAQSRTEMAQFRAEIRQIWDYLMHRSQNGGSPP